MFPLYYTGVGKRKDNQDYYLLKLVNDNFLLGVADGVGGNNGGDVASKLAIKIFSNNFIENLATNNIEKSLEKSFKLAHEAVVEYGLNNLECINMATTLSVAYITQNELHVCHSGDSRVYLLRNNGIKQLTSDDTEANQLMEEGLLSKKDIESYPRKNILTNALGVKSNFSVQIIKHDIEDLDRVILLTDGFYQSLSKTRLRSLSVSEKEFSNFFFNSVYECQSEYPDDNFTIVALEVALNQ